MFTANRGRGRRRPFNRQCHSFLTPLFHPFTDVEALLRGATDAFARAAEQIGAPGLITRSPN